jgi:cyclin-dependent kinase 10
MNSERSLSGGEGANKIRRIATTTATSPSSSSPQPPPNPPPSSRIEPEEKTTTTKKKRRRPAAAELQPPPPPSHHHHLPGTTANASANAKTNEIVHHRGDEDATTTNNTITTANTRNDAASRSPPPANAGDDAANVPRMTAGVCERVSERYEKVGRIGEGTYGVVYSAIDRKFGDANKKKQKEKEKGGVLSSPSSSHSRSSSNHKRQPHMVALKRCIPHHESSDGFPVTTLREIHALRVCCQHPNVVNLLDVAVSNHGVFLVFEHCEHDLAHILDMHHEKMRHARTNNHKRHKHNNGGAFSFSSSSSSSSPSPFTEPHVKTLTHQLLGALEYCHSHYLIHRDVKPSNLLYGYSYSGDDEGTGTLKLADFGLSRTCRGAQPTTDAANMTTMVSMTPNVVSLWYRAPELMLPKRTTSNPYAYSFPIDLWAVGCVVAELLGGIPLLDGRTEPDQIHRMVQCLGRPPTRIYGDNYCYNNNDDGDGGRKNNNNNRGTVELPLWDRFDYLSPEGLTLLTRMLEYDPNERWTATEALASGYFTTPPLMATNLPRFDGLE